MKDQWLSQVKGDPSSELWEISVVKESNTHGRRSWGWFDENKLLISHNASPCQWPMAPGLGKFMVELAHRYADYLNQGGKEVEFKMELLGNEKCPDCPDEQKEIEEVLYECTKKQGW